MAVPGGTAGGMPTVVREGVPLQSTMGAPNYRYSVPHGGVNDPHYHDSPVTAYSDSLRAVPGGTPDPMRTQSMPVRTTGPNANQVPQEWYTGHGGRGNDVMGRHGVEYQDADGWAATAPNVRRMAPHAESVRPEEPRATSRMAPRTYTFTRPFDQHSARYNNGIHFSMADHRRTYPILGMATPGTRRNTYRTDPAPWDANLVDMPNPDTGYRPGQIVAYDIPPMGNRSGRL
jgi:hypothetical protein